MKIRVRYDNQITCIDVPEEDFTLMIQADYDERRAAEVDPSSIRPRTPQEIFEERFNRPDYNNWHRHWRHTDDNAIPRRLDHKVGYIGDHPDDPYEQKLLGITAMEKLLGKKHFAELLAGLVERPQGKPVLVTEDDKRPEMNTAQNDFNE